MLLCPISVMMVIYHSVCNGNICYIVILQAKKCESEVVHSVGTAVRNCFLILTLSCTGLCNIV